MLLCIALMEERESEEQLGIMKDRLVSTFPFLHASNARKPHHSSSITTKASLKVLSNDFFFFFLNKFALGEYVHVHSVVYNFWFVKCLQITKFTPKITLLSNKKTHANGI